MINKQIERIRRGKRTRQQIKEAGKVRLCVYRTPMHIYAQVVSADNGKVLASASTVEAALKTELKATGNATAAELVGKVVAERALKNGVETVAFDRSGYLYHGRVKALAESARKHGLKF